MRVIAGQYRSRRLRSVPGTGLRPTADRLRETLFNVLASGSVPLEGAGWLDLFAGSGAVGIEALSRGAAMVYFVESNPRAAAIIGANLASLAIGTRFEVIQRDATEALRHLAHRDVRCSFCFLDPPWARTGEYQKVLAAIGDLPLIDEHGIAIAEHERHFDPGEQFGRLRRFRKLEQGDAVLSFYRNGGNVKC
ncbi:MAG: 16S rRNA (guanine(966)-N(2))-methyltransferase RsmD [Acidobacteria bacterium]|nr:16S rRNA (guanine(966)-N(2))-methyltransferase RsmD [Acidobacteriota bacterium]